jgi:hypothetical protein
VVIDIHSNFYLSPFHLRVGIIDGIFEIPSNPFNMNSISS